MESEGEKNEDKSGEKRSDLLKNGVLPYFPCFCPYMDGFLPKKTSLIFVLLILHLILISCIGGTREIG